MNDEQFKEAMGILGNKYHEQLMIKDSAEAEINNLRVGMMTLLRAANRSECDEPDIPVVVTYKMKRTAERMKKGGKEMLRNVLTPDQWKAIYNEPGEAVSLLVKRRKE